jgi:phosphate transport system substrate-binding protein
MKTTFAGLLLVATLFPATHLFAQALSVNGSETLLDLSQRWADAYKAKQPGVAIQVSASGAAAAFAALAGKKLDLALVARSIRYKEADACEAALGQRPAAHKVAVYGIAVYVNANNPVKVLTYDELFGIYRGKHKSWKDVGGEKQPITVFTQNTNSAPGELFNEEVLAGKGVSGKVQTVTDADMLKAIANDPNSIGFAALAEASGVRPVGIKRAYSTLTPADPTAETISKRTYPISRFVYAYTDAAADKAGVKAYLEWVRSDEGQQIAKAAGYYLLPAPARSGP